MKTKFGVVLAGVFATALISAGPVSAEPASAPTPDVAFSTVADVAPPLGGGTTEGGAGGGCNNCAPALPRLSSLVPWPLSEFLASIGL
jgi:hypothetical protein